MLTHVTLLAVLGTLTANSPRQEANNITSAALSKGMTMAGIKIQIELDNTQKLEIGIVTLVLCVIGFFIWHNWGYWSGTQLDRTIVTWVEDHNVGTDPAKPVSVANPEDPTRHFLLTVFANNDGKLQIKENLADEGKRLALSFTPDPHRDRFLAKWPVTADTIERIKDPVRQVIAVHGLSERPQHWLLTSAGFSDAQKASESDARAALRTDLVYIDETATEGAVDPHAFAAFTAALNAYNALDKEHVSKDVRDTSAMAVMDTARAYLFKVQDAKDAAIKKYVDLVDKLLDSDQRAKLLNTAPTFLVGHVRSPKAG